MLAAVDALVQALGARLDVTRKDELEVDGLGAALDDLTAQLGQTIAELKSSTANSAKNWRELINNYATTASLIGFHDLLW